MSDPIEPNDEENEQDEQLEEEKEVGIEEPKKEAHKVDALGFFCFLIFVCVVFFLLTSYWLGAYPFTTTPIYSMIGAFVGYQVIFDDKVVFQILYGVAYGTLLIGLWRYKYEPWLIILVAILGAMLFFMFFF